MARGERGKDPGMEGVGWGESVSLRGFQAPKGKMRVKLVGFQTSGELVTCKKLFCLVLETVMEY